MHANNIITDRWEVGEELVLDTLRASDVICFLCKLGKSRAAKKYLYIVCILDVLHSVKTNLAHIYKAVHCEKCRDSCINHGRGSKGNMYLWPV